MTQIESVFENVEESKEKVFAFLSDLNNHQKLMPNQVSDWWSNNDEAKMRIQGLGALHLKKSETKENSYLKITPVGATPVDLFLEWVIEPEDGYCKVKTIINAELNMMMRMVATKPLQNLADFMAGRVNKAIKEI
ncbi:MAG: SRPBCC family protein [Bacteroidia bacterium]